jgi:hypothetical protein
VVLPEVRVEALDDDAVARWDRFIEAAPGATLFHRAGWRTVVERSFGQSCHFLQAKCSGRITGVLPLVHVSSHLFGHRLISGAYGLYGGPVASDDASLEALNRAAEQLAQELGVDYLEYRLLPALEPTLSAQLRSLCDLPQAAGAGPRRQFRRSAAQAAGDDPQGARARAQDRAGS